MLKILKYINVFKLIKLVKKYGEHAKLIADTATFYHEQGIARGIIKAETEVEETK